MLREKKKAKFQFVLTSKGTIEISMYIDKAEQRAETGTVKNQTIIISMKSFQLTEFLCLLYWPTKTTEPTLQWVVLIGSPILEAMRTVNAAPISIVKPVEGVILAKSSPTVWITLRPQTMRPIEMPTPPKSIR